MSADIASGGRGRGLDALVDATGSLRAVGLMRALFGCIVVAHFWPTLRADRVPVERFHVPWWSWLPVPSPDLYRGLVWVGVAAGVAMVVGVACRVATATAFAVVTYLLFVDMTGFAHNRALLVWVLALLALLPTDRAVALDALGRRDDRGLLWPLFVLRIVAASVYLTSGATKLADPDWRGGLVLWDRVNRGSHLIPFDGWIHDLLVSRTFHSVLAPSAIAVEGIIGVGLWFPRTRLVAIWTALAFHGVIEVTAAVQTFSYSMIAATLIWVTPATGDRELRGGTTALRAAVRWLDWLGRFTLVGPPGAPLSVRDRDGSIREGADARLTVLSRLPLTFFVVAPALAVQRLRHRRRNPPTPRHAAGRAAPAHRV